MFKFNEYFIEVAGYFELDVISLSKQFPRLEEHEISRLHMELSQINDDIESTYITYD
jgi:hypothetical protein